MTVAAFRELPPATAPAETRRGTRADVKLLVATRGGGALRPTRFSELPRLLRTGDLLVVNTSATLPAALPARLDGTDVHLFLRGASRVVRRGLEVPGLPRLAAMAAGLNLPALRARRRLARCGRLGIQASPGAFLLTLDNTYYVDLRLDGRLTLWAICGAGRRWGSAIAPAP